MSFHPLWPVLALGVVALVLSALGLRGRPLRRPSTWRRVGLALLVVLVGLRPAAGEATSQVAGIDADVVIMLDRTTSMAAEDWNGSSPRLVGARADVAELVKTFAGARFAVVTFDNVARVDMPLTTDTNALVALVDATGWRDNYYSTGSSISLGIPTATEVLEAARTADPERRRYVVYLGDGEQTVDEAPKSFAEMKPLVDDALVLGYGTQQGGRMKARPDANYYVYDKDYKDAISRIDEPNLQAIATQLGGTYLHRTAPGEIAFRPRTGSGDVFGQSTPTGAELYWLPALGLVALLGWELWDHVAAYRVARRELA